MKTTFAPGDPSTLLVEDMHQLREMIQKENPGVPYFMLGHSMGSYLLRRYLSVHGEGLTGAIIMGTGFVDPGTAAMGAKVSSALALLRGWKHRSRFVSSLAFGKLCFHKARQGPEPLSRYISLYDSCRII